MTAFTPPHPNEDPALEAGRLLTRIGVFLLFVVALIAPVIAGQTIYILLPVGAVLLLLGSAVAPDRREKTGPLREFLTSPPFLAALFLAAWAAVSLNWTPFHGGPAERYWKDAGTLGLVAIACGFLPARTRICDLNLLPIGVAAAAIGMIAAAVYGFFARRSFTLEEILDGDALARSGVGLVLIMWPACGALAMRGKWRFAAALMLVSGVAVLLPARRTSRRRSSSALRSSACPSGVRARRGFGSRLSPPRRSFWLRCWRSSCASSSRATRRSCCAAWTSGAIFS